MSKIIIGVMGPGEGATSADMETAHKLGHLIAENGWILLTGGRNEGVMEAACRGAREAGGLTLGILPSSDGTDQSDYVDIPVLTGMGSARNQINVLTSRLIIACGIGLGTLSEISLALKVGKKVIMLNASETTVSFFRELSDANVYHAGSPEEAVKQANILLK